MEFGSDRRCPKTSKGFVSVMSTSKYNYHRDNSGAGQ